MGKGLNHQAALTGAMQRPGFKQSWDALEEGYSTLHALLDARKAAGLTQEELAQRMGTTKSAVSRLEASLRMNTMSKQWGRSSMNSQDHINPG